MAIHQLIPPFPKNIDREGFAHWLSGFSDGEACFLLKTAPVKSRGKIYPTIRAEFIIDLRDDDILILKDIQSFWGCGNVVKRTSRAGAHPGARFYVARTAHAFEIVVDHFDRYPLRAKKKRDFAIWRQGVQLHYEVQDRPAASQGYNKGPARRMTDSDWNTFRNLELALKAQRVYESPGWLQITPACGSLDGSPRFREIHQSRVSCRD